MQQQELTGDLLDFSGAWPKVGELSELLPDLISRNSSSFNYIWSPAGDMASSLEQHGNTESRGNVARLVDRLSKDISLLNNSSFKPGEVHLRKAGNLGGNGAKIAVVRFSYLAQQEDELDLKEGDELEVLEDVEDGWARGQIIGMIEAGAPNAIGKIGLFPTNFVSFASEMPANNPSVFSTSITSSLPRVIEEKGHIENHSNGGESTETAKKDCMDGSHHQQQHSATLPSTLHKSTVVAGGNRRTNPLSSTTDCAPSPPTGMVNAALPLSHPPVIPPPPSQAAIAVSRTKEMAKVIYKYEAANPDELSLPEGALITVINKKCEDDGWYEGEYNGKRGLFPENFVKLIETSASVEKASPVGSHPPPILPAKPAKPLHSASQMPVASVRDSSVSQIDPCLSAAAAGPRPVQEERKSMIAGLQSKLFPTGKLPPHRPPQPLGHPNEGKEAKSASSSVEDLSKLSSLTKTRPKQANKRPPSMNFRASKQPTGANANTFDESPVLGATSFNSSISSAGSGAGRPDSFFSTSSLLGKEAAGAPPKTNAATKQPVVKQLGQSPLDPQISLVSAAPRFSAINTACPLPSPSSSSSSSSEWISRKEFEKYRTEVNRKLEEMGEKLAELSALKNK